MFAHTRATAALVTGSCRDPRTGVHTYGGVRRRSSWPPLRFRLVSPAANRPVRCETVHGNVLLVPREAYRALGNLDEGFAHMVGDFDYGLRAGQLGIPCWIAPGFLAQCARHPVRGSMHDASLPLKQRLALARRPTGRTAWRQWMRFTRRHTGWRWPLFWAETLVSRVLLLWLWLLIVGKRPESDQ